MTFLTGTFFVVLATVTFLESARAFALTEMTGEDLRGTLPQLKTVTLKTSDKATTVIVFMSAKCPCSISHLPEIKSLATDFPNVQFIGIDANQDETREMGQAYFSQAGLPFPVLRDEKSKYAYQLKAVKTPHAFVLDSSGNVLFQGGVSDSAKFPHANKKYLREALTDLKLGVAVRTPLARALGCAINRGN